MRLLALTTGLIIASFILACDSSQQVVAGASADSTITLAATGGPQPVRGYVMSRWHDEIPAAEDAGDCPAGLNLTEEEYFPEQWASWMAEARRRRDAGGYLGWDDERLPPDACREPLAQPDPGFLLMEGPAVVHGLDLDGIDSRSADATGGSCAHDDFAGHDGATGIDNQFWRLMGCIRGFRPNDLMDRLNQSNGAIKEGGFAILLEISGMDDPLNDDEVEVQLISANHPVTVSAVGDVMQNVSFTTHKDTRYHNEIAKGKIVDGVLTTEPVDFRIKVKKQTMDNEYWLRDARIRGEIQPDGRIEGVVGAYYDIANLWSTLNEQWIGDHHQGRNAARSRGFMCAGIYHAMPRVADGHPDPATGECTSISMSIRFEAVPAFVVRPQLAAAL